jgi:hypothetical protein
VGDSATNGKTNGKWWAIAPFIISSLMGIAFAYGTSLATNATMRADITNLQRDNVELHKQVDYYRDNYTSHAELKYYIDGQTRILESIQGDVREIRKGR